MKSLSLYCICLIAIMALAISSARADYHYASHEGSDEYPFTSWGTGAHLIQDAIDASSPHDTVYIGAGEWYEATATGVYDSIAIIGMGIDSTFCYTDSFQTAVMTIDHGCLVEGITFQHLNSWKCLRARTFAGVDVRHCKFVNSSIGLNASGGPTEITDCIFDSCGIAIFLTVWVGDFYIANNIILNTLGSSSMLLQAETVIVENNIIITQPDVPVNVIAGSPIHAIIRNNVIIGGFGGIGVANQKYNNIVKDINSPWSEFAIGGSYVDTIYNNLILNCRRGVVLWSVEEGLTVSYNAFWKNEIDIESSGYDFDSVGNIFCDPMLISEDDFHLQAFSPLIDAGDPNLLDVDGTRSDIGAYGGPQGESYEYLDLPPAIPDSLSGELIADSIILNWRYNTEADFSNYYLYRDTVSGFEPSIFNLIAEPETSYYADIDIIPGEGYYYRISAQDNQGNVSGYSEELEVIATGIWNGMGVEPPRITTIEGNYPNPFNSSTTIIYSVANLGPIPAEIKIVIYDITGRRVRLLLDERKEVGDHRITWDGANDNGEACPSGIYFARIVQWDLGFLGRHQKLVLVR